MFLKRGPRGEKDSPMMSGITRVIFAQTSLPASCKPQGVRQESFRYRYDYAPVQFYFPSLLSGLMRSSKDSESCFTTDELERFVNSLKAVASSRETDLVFRESVFPYSIRPITFFLGCETRSLRRQASP